jgi:hypothetical protein
MTFPIRAFAAIAAFPALALSTPAFAAYEVSVETSSRAGHAYPTLCSYNGNTTDGCQNGGSLSTKGGSGALATYASASTSQSGYDYGQTSPESTSIVAVSDLTTASLHMASSNASGAPQSSYGSDGFASFNDVLHLSVAGASADTVTAISVSFAIDGTLASPAGAYPFAGVGDFYGLMTFGTSQAQFNFTNDITTGFKTLGTFGTGASSYPGTWSYASDYTTATYTETYDITGAEADIAVAARANMDCSNGSSCQFGNTAKFIIDAPTGTSFTSDSGVFLTGGTSAVPEPATWAMMMIGLGALGAGLRQRRRQGKLAVV